MAQVKVRLFDNNITCAIVGLNNRKYRSSEVQRACSKVPGSSGISTATRRALRTESRAEVNTPLEAGLLNALKNIHIN